MIVRSARRNFAHPELFHSVANLEPGTQKGGAKMAVETPARLEGAELERSLESQVAQRTWGRVRDLRVEVTPQRVVVHGYTSRYYVKQLALHAVLEALRSVAPLPVVIDIEVGPLVPAEARS
jgi:hypothetical protein